MGRMEALRLFPLRAGGFARLWSFVVPDGRLAWSGGFGSSVFCSFLDLLVMLAGVCQ